MKNMTVDVQPVSASTGAEILGVDLTERLNEQACREIRNALHEYGVLFFRRQALSPAQHLAFAQQFGTAEIDPTTNLRYPDGYPLIAEVRKEPDQTRNIGGNWHTDHSFDEAPPLGSVLMARELPAEGGDTLFINMHAVYETLSAGLKRTLEGLRAVHAKTQAYEKLSADRKVSADEKSDVHDKFGRREAIHPVVIRHPESGHKILYINPTYTVRFDGWTAEESEPLLRFLYQHATRPEFSCRFRWREGSIAFWDNRTVWHYALNDYHGSRRLMHRVTLAGSPLS